MKCCAGFITLFPVVAAMLLLCGAGADRLSLPRSKDAEPYQAHLREVERSFSPRLDGWTAKDAPVPTEAVDMLKPNILISRVYANPATGEQFSVLLVQCADVRDLVPHYPPMCYPGHGLDLVNHRLKNWNVGGHDVSATEYEFESAGFAHNDPLVVENFMVLPVGRCVPDMPQVRKQVALSTRYFGAAEVQVVFSARMPSPRRDQIVAECLSSYLPLIEAIESGIRAN